MKQLEDALKRQLNEDQAITYPDFDEMWTHIEQAESDSSWLQAGRASAIPRRPRSWSKIAAVVSLSVLVAAAPVYAAIHYDWGNLLRSNEGIQAALDQNLGQYLGQSITKDGVTLTLQTAIVDENRTVILYSLDVGKHRETDFWNVKGMTLKGTNSSYKEGEYNYEQWDEENQRYNGYFESDWTPGQDTAKIILTADAVTAVSVQDLEIPLDIKSMEMQSFPIGKGGMQKVEVQPFTQSKDKLLLSSAVTFDDPMNKEGIFPQIVAYNGTTRVTDLSGGTFGEPGEHGEYKMRQYLKTDDITAGQTAFKLEYSKQEQNISGPWSFDLQLSKKQMESGTHIKALQLPLETGDTENTIEKLAVTPTQIRLSVRTEGKSFRRQMPYKKYFLEVSGKTLEGKFFGYLKDDPTLLNLRFERPAGLLVDEGTPITFVGKYKVTIHTEDKAPTLLKNISTQKQTLIRDVGGYPVEWTYYMQGKDLYIETGSDDPHFGGINQTHLGESYDKLPGKPVTANFSGDGNNKAIDVYKDFKDREVSLYMYYYTTDDPDKETRVQLQP
ncbi:RNA polymerase subunit sigma [Paenibacillus sp. P3E]|uniref:DUF4179 domain-containing protein n=1 Tax=unclassified Paenibacillus TaxID=185978 RepID=UPI00093D8EF2|nr:MULTISPECIES: DUF4179 domain-containing protein [unclassified Paenibacillus]OKP69559.1 RNA polymerase subunit sigma [Paenibacillus sp. P3E]OKP89980.1 RNA polymerase subunit sigma [Paenibacillus sp. P32E]